MKARARENWRRQWWIVHSSEHDGKGGEGVEQTEAVVCESKLELELNIFFLLKVVSEI